MASARRAAVMLWIMPEAEAARVTWMGTLSSFEAEREFREAGRAADDTVVRVVAAFLVVAHVAFALVDRALFGPTPQVAWLAVFRITLVTTVVMLAALIRRFRPSTIDLVLAAVQFVSIPLQVWVTLTRPPTFVGPLAATMLAITLSVIVLPVPLRLLAPVSLVSCIAQFAARMALPGTTSASVISTASVLFIGWTGAVIVSAFLRRSRRTEYLALREQHALRKTLEQALAEIRTLRGIVPICAFCKKIRDESGEWQRVEVYVRERTHAEFSHGFCPTCAHEHYGDLAEEPAE